MRDLFARCAAPPQPRVVVDVFFLDEANQSHGRIRKMPNHSLNVRRVAACVPR